MFPSQVATPAQESDAASGKFHLRTTLVTPFVLQIVVAVGLVGYLSFRNSQQAVYNVVGQLRSELTTRIVEKLQTYTNTPHAINRLNAAAAIKGAIDFNALTGERVLSQPMVVYPQMSANYIGTEAGVMFSVGRFSAKDPLQLEASGRQTNFRKMVYDLSDDGRRLRFNKRIDKFYDPRRRPWFKAAKAARKAVWSEVYLDFTTMMPCVTASLPIYSKTDGKLIGVCGTDLFLPAEASKFLQQLEIGKTGTAFIIERSGQLVATSGQEPMTSGEGEKTERLFAAASANPAIKNTAQYLKTQAGGFEGFKASRQLDFLMNGQRQFVQVAPFQDLNIDWLVVLTIPEADFMQEINRQTNITLIICLLALLAAIGVGIFTAGGITWPLEQITRSSQEMAAGRLGQNIPPSRIVELDTLGGSFNSMARQLKESFEILEEKVEARTAELASANDEITSLNDRLKAENLHLGAELDVARQIQCMILPRPEELQIDGLDIAGCMEPAEEVGGDYYDVLQRDGHVLIGIGDVTGHGLESGLLMLMTQTAVRTLQESRQSDPVQFLDILNRTLHGNVQRLGSTKSLTLAILDYHEGSVRVSGQHEEVLVVRAGGTVERLDTVDLGFPIAFDEEMAGYVNSVEIALQPGDGLVLYTDGITEAFNADRKQYGLERLCEVVGQNWNRDADGVREATMQDVRAHISTNAVLDDITLLVFKRQ